MASIENKKRALKAHQSVAMNLSSSFFREFREDSPKYASIKQTNVSFVHERAASCKGRKKNLINVNKFANFTRP